MDETKVWPVNGPLPCEGPFILLARAEGEGQQKGTGPRTAAEVHCHPVSIIGKYETSMTQITFVNKKCL